MANIIKTRLTLAVILCLGSTAMSAPPDLTNGGIPGDSITFNLGPTGARGWTYHAREDTSASRQILVTQVAAGSPAAGILAPDDVILGVDGSGAQPVRFSSDARKSLGLAIGAAEARNPAGLKLLRWRAGVTSTVEIMLETMGAYSATAPYDCPKSALILERGLQYIMTQPVPEEDYMETAGRYSFGTLSLLAANNHNPADPDNAARMARAQTEARALIPSAATMEQLMSDELALQDNRVEEGNFFAKMAAAAASERGEGHTGAFFNYLWAPLGAATGGEQAAASHFSRISWMLDLNRRWDDAFDYDCLTGEGANSGAQWSDFRMSTAALLVYALPLRQLHITGRAHDPARWLAPADVAGFPAVDGYAATSRSTSELVADLGSWSPMVQRRAAEQLATRSINSNLLAQITSLATDPAGGSRIGACYTLGRISNSSTANARAATLAGLLEDPENHVRFMAAEAMRYLPDSAKLTQLDTILRAAANTAKPLFPFDEEDPLHFAHGRLAMLLFYSGTAYGPKGFIYGNKINTPTVINRNLLYPAISAVAANPIGMVRGTLTETYKNLTAADVAALADTLVDSIHFRAPADKMFSAGIRNSGLFALERYGIAEGVPLSIAYMVEDGRSNSYTSALGVLEDYAGSCTIVLPDPDVIGFCKSLLTGSQAAAAQAVLNAIAADTNPAPLTPFKSIQSVTADAPSLSLPVKRTVLRVNSTDLAKGDSIYTWRKVHGAGNVSFFPNGTGASKNTSILFDGTPGHYLFEVKMSDSRNFTEVYQTVAVTLRNSDGTLPPDNPPTADPQSIAVSQATPAPITLTGSDPEGYPLVYTVTTQPLHGTLSGTVPYLLYSPDFNHTGPDSFTFKVTDSQGQVSTATIDITVGAAGSFGLAIYEPFDYPAGALNGKSGSSEVGLGGTWAASASAKVVDGPLAYGLLPTLGGSIGNLNTGSNNYGGTRAIDASALAANGLLNDGATLWFSVVMGYGSGGNLTNSRLAFALSNSNFSTGNYQYFIVNEGVQLGSGLGVTLGRFSGGNGQVVATQFRDSSFGTSGWSGNIFGTVPNTVIGTESQRLVVGKISWGASPSDDDTIELFEPDTDLVLGSPTSTLAVNVNQSTFDAITWCRGDVVTLDEIRFGPNLLSVLLGNSAMTADLSPPVPNPVGFHSAPAPSGPSSITMVAATAYDAMGVEYYFTCTAGGGHDSGWQDGTSYTDTGLTPGVPYSYTVKARDKSPAKNTTTPSAAASATIATQAIVPDVLGLPQTTAGSFITASNLSVGNVTHVLNASVPPGEVISQNPSGETIAAIGAAVDVVVSIGPDSIGYEIWAGDPGGAFLGALADPSADGDFDGGGLPTGIEWVVGGDPTDGSDDAGRAPTFHSNDPDNFIFTFRRRDAAHADPDTAITVEYATGLSGWNTAIHGGNGVSVDDTAVPEEGFHTVVVSLPKTLAGPGGRLFARLKVATTP